MKKNSKIVLMVLLGLFAGLEILYFLQLNQTPFADLLMVDAKAYHLKALHLLEKGWIGDSVSYQAPFYPYFLALIYKIFGLQRYWVHGIQALLAMAATLMIFKLGKTLFNEKVGLCSASLFVFYGVFLFYNGLLSKVTLSVFFTSLLLLILLKALDRSSGALYYWAGGMLGFNLTLRENYFLVLPGLLFWILFLVPPPALASRWRNIKWALFFLGGI
jgi:4-amino-4-deoxy-L-arabinose transferase-like glycosyltransferase